MVQIINFWSWKVLLEIRLIYQNLPEHHSIDNDQNCYSNEPKWEKLISGTFCDGKQTDSHEIDGDYSEDYVGSDEKT